MSRLLCQDTIPWWVKIQTTIPACQYYFGPFSSIEDAEAHQQGYVEDLLREQALEIVVKITRCQPEVLTLYDEEEFQGESINRLFAQSECTTVLTRC
ncbi:DUF1816 domain-containing protein [Acaryochloris sp. IP29b_bin.137]|uniref:DUF1816 domain-containing protein n=1 Tax=Acaryochloris sp. IP29b_bin.137 TaxID=2969217 RepID=UPI0026252287|nr:DUF1816 domain-containing protein [Acaryochloris sp. IP29b_bin.137]